MAEPPRTYEFTKDGIGEALRALGATVDEVAASLSSMNVKGIREDPCSCPVAQYLGKTVPDARLINVYRERVVAFEDEESWQKQDTNGIWLSVTTPAGVEQFIHTFDNNFNVFYELDEVSR